MTKCPMLCADEEKKVRKKARENREGVPTIGIVGYTNAGHAQNLHR